MNLRPDRSGRITGAPTALACLALILTACATPAAGPQGQSAPASSSTGPTTLQLAFREDPTTIHGGSTGTPEREVAQLLNAGLSAFSPSGDLVPKLAVKVPSVADGDWTITPDGGMEITWKLKPGLKWHDGTAL